MSIYSFGYISRRHLLTFVIALIAGLAAAIMPRLSAELVIYQQFGENVRVSLFRSNAIWMILVFSLFVGLCATILMSRHAVLDPPKIFLTALGIPALLAGSASTIQSTAVLELQQHSQHSVLERLLAMPPARPILTVPLNELQPLSIDPTSDASDLLNELRTPSEVSLVKRANAQENPNVTTTPGEEQPSSNTEDLGLEGQRLPMLPDGSISGGWNVPSSPGILEFDNILDEQQYRVGLGGISSTKDASEIRELLSKNHDLDFDIFQSTTGEEFYLISPEPGPLWMITWKALSLEEMITVPSNATDMSVVDQFTNEQNKNAQPINVIITPVGEN